MREYLGEEKIKKEDSQFQEYGVQDFALLFIEMYGHIDGDHHKAWLLDQLARILNDSEVFIKKASWGDGTSEFRFTVGTSQKYLDWVKKMKAGEDGPETYSYDEGIAP